jgi:hypothetical protein
MDPNVTMQLLREALANNDVNEAVYLMKILDEWLSKGGFLPRAWYAAARNTQFG